VVLKPNKTKQETKHTSNQVDIDGSRLTEHNQSGPSEKHRT